MRDRVVDVADEAQRQMVVLRINPARARQPAAQARQRLSDIGRNFDAGEEPRHGDDFWLYDPRPVRARAIKTSTCGRIRATITSTPAAVGCRPSPWLNLASSATPSRKNG